MISAGPPCGSFVPRDGRFPGDPHGRVGWGGVGDDNVPCTCTHGRCYATSSFFDLHTWSVLRNIMGWGGVGVGWGMITFLALAHMVAGTQHHGMGWGGVGWGMITFLALAHMVAATQHHGMGWGGVGWGMITFFALAHMVAATQHHGMGWGGVGWGMITFFALAHMVAATQHHGMGWGGVGDDNVPCTCTHGRWYATSWDGVGAGWGDDNVSLHLHTWSVLRNIIFL